MFKIMKKETLNHLISLIPKCEKTIRIRNNHTLTYNCRKDCFSYSFYLLMYLRCLAQFRREHKKLRVNFNI